MAGLMMVLGLSTVTIGAEELSTKWVGKDAPPFRLKNLANTYERFYYTEPTVLDFFATWCAPCKAELPQLLKFYRTTSRYKFKFAILNSEEDRSVLEGFASDQNIEKALIIPHANSIFKKFGVTALPTLIVIDANGKVQAVIVGGRPDIEAELDAVLKRISSTNPSKRDTP